MSKFVLIILWALAVATAYFLGALLISLWPRLNKHERWFSALTPQEKNVVLLWLSDEIGAGELRLDVPVDWIFYAYKNFPPKYKK